MKPVRSGCSQPELNNKNRSTGLLSLFLSAPLIRYSLMSGAASAVQYLLLLFLPKAFGKRLAGVEYLWPGTLLSFAGFSYRWIIFGFPVLRSASGEVLIGGGLGYFLAYEISILFAHTAGFPLQRNFTFHSRGSVGRQLFYYYSSWILVSLPVNAVNGLWFPIAQYFLPATVYDLLVLVVSGLFFWIAFFFINRRIFTDR